MAFSDYKILVTFQNGRSCWIKSNTAAKRDQLIEQFESKIKAVRSYGPKRDPKIVKQAARAKERKYTSQESHEQAYKKYRKSKIQSYKKARKAAGETIPKFWVGAVIQGGMAAYSAYSSLTPEQKPIAKKLVWDLAKAGGKPWKQAKILKSPEAKQLFASLTPEQKQQLIQAAATKGKSKAMKSGSAATTIPKGSYETGGQIVYDNWLDANGYDYISQTKWGKDGKEYEHDELVAKFRKQMPDYEDEEIYSKGGKFDKFEMGTPVQYRTTSYSGDPRIETGEVVSRKGRKAIRLYKDSNYAGPGERLRYFDEIDIKDLRNFNEKFETGGSVDPYWNIDFVWKDSPEDLITGYVIKDTKRSDEDDDEYVFYYFESPAELQNSLKAGKDNKQEFIILRKYGQGEKSEWSAPNYDEDDYYAKGGQPTDKQKRYFGSIGDKPSQHKGKIRKKEIVVQDISTWSDKEISDYLKSAKGETISQAKIKARRKHYEYLVEQNMKKYYQENPDQYAKGGSIELFAIVDDDDKLFAEGLTQFNAEQLLTRLLNYEHDVYLVDNDYEHKGKSEFYEDYSKTVWLSKGGQLPNIKAGDTWKDPAGNKLKFTSIKGNKATAQFFFTWDKKWEKGGSDTIQMWQDLLIRNDHKKEMGCGGDLDTLKIGKKWDAEHGGKIKHNKELDSVKGINNIHRTINGIDYTAANVRSSNKDAVIGKGILEEYGNQATILVEDGIIGLYWRNPKKMKGGYYEKGGCAVPVQVYSPTNSLGIPRIEMPQISPDKEAEFEAELEDDNVTFTKETVDATCLKPTQREINIKKVDNMPTSVVKGIPVITSSDNYILDGHHRWYKAVLNDMAMPILKASIPIKQLLDYAYQFDGTSYAKLKMGGKLFQQWIDDGNVIEKSKGIYATQDAQYKNNLKGKTELYEYYKKEFGES